MENFEYEIDRSTVTPVFLNGISRDIPRILSDALKMSSLKINTPLTPLGAEAAEEVYILMRNSLNQGRKKRNESLLTDEELVERLENDIDFYARKLGLALLCYEIRV